MKIVLWTCLVLAFKGLRADVAPHHISHDGIRSAAGVEPSAFANKLFQKYGNSPSGYFDAKKFDSLLGNLGIGNDVNTKNARSVDKNVSIA